jgi:hypothetical protein
MDDIGNPCACDAGCRHARRENRHRQNRTTGDAGTRIYAGGVRHRGLRMLTRCAPTATTQPMWSGHAIRVQAYRRFGRN